MINAPRVTLTTAVKYYGGFTELAKRLNLALSTVHGWKLRGSLPDWRADQIAAVVKHDRKKRLRRKKKTTTRAPNGVR